jgi:hypothetical protein
MLSAPFAVSLNSSPEWTTEFDVESWRNGGYADDLAIFKMPKPQIFSTSVAPEQRTLIESRIATFGERPAGLGKFTRTMFARDLRRNLRRTESIAD